MALLLNMLMAANSGISMASFIEQMALLLNMLMATKSGGLMTSFIER
jgi:hypothetical protein